MLVYWWEMVFCVQSFNALFMNFSCVYIYNYNVLMYFIYHVDVKSHLVYRSVPAGAEVPTRLA